MQVKYKIGSTSLMLPEEFQSLPICVRSSQNQRDNFDEIF